MSQAKRRTPDEARPFLKWAGGKLQLLTQFEEHYPSELKQGKLTRYVEPFLGGGAVFLSVAQTYRIEEAYLSDINPELILAYTVVKEQPDKLIQILRDYEERYLNANEQRRSDFFYSIRAEYNEQVHRIDFECYSDEWVSRTARMIFLNKTCFNGLFRVNAKGEFNVPFGRNKNPTICDADNLLAASNVLQNATLVVGPFTKWAHVVNANTFVYFDPPYRPISETSNFTSYTRGGFDDSQQVALADFFAHLDRTTGAKLMLSNSDPTSINSDDLFFDNLYADFNIHRVMANRMINSLAHKRGKIAELLITNY